MRPNVPTKVREEISSRRTNRRTSYTIPLQVIGARVFVFVIGAKGANVAGRLVDEAVPYHLVFAFEAPAAFGSMARLDGAIVRSILGMHICVRAGITLVSSSNGESTIEGQCKVFEKWGSWGRSIVTHLSRYWV